MTSLEFINQNIFECKNHIEHLENKIIEDKKYPSFVKCHKERIEELKPILKVLEQIKTELEAWEAIKKHIEYFPENYWNGIPKELITLTSPFSREDYLIIKKALEVEDE